MCRILGASFFNAARSILVFDKCATPPPPLSVLRVGGWRVYFFVNIAIMVYHVTRKMSSISASHTYSVVLGAF